MSEPYVGRHRRGAAATRAEYRGRHRAAGSRRVSLSLPVALAGPVVAPVAVLAAGAAGALGAGAALSPDAPGHRLVGAGNAPVAGAQLGAAALADVATDRSTTGASPAGASTSTTRASSASRTSQVTASAAARNPLLAESSTHVALQQAVSRSGARASLAGATGGVGGSMIGARTSPEAAAADRARAEKVSAEARARAARLKADTEAKRWVRPLDGGYVLTSAYGMRWGRMHPAQDLAIPVGAPVRAMSSGTVVEARWNNSGYGKRVVIRYWDGTVSWYAHNSSFAVQAGDTVTPGQVVAYSGNTGWSTGPHLHLEIRPDGQTTVPPATWFQERGLSL